MKKTVALLGLLLTAVPGKACDVCGGTGASGAYITGGFTPENQVSFGYQYLSFRSRHLPSMLKGQEGVERISKEQFHLPQLSGRWSFARKWQATAVLPYQHVTKKLGSSITQMGGLADIQIGIANYQGWDSLRGNTSFQMMTEYSLKLPSGAYHTTQINEDISRYMLPGTGSVDHLLRILTQLERKTWRLNIGGVFRYNGRGPEGLKWGRRWQFQSGIGKSFSLGKMNTLHTGVSYLLEGSSADFQNEASLPFSSYRVGSLQASLFWRYKKIALAGSCFQTLHGSLGEGRVDILARCLFQFVYYPGGKK